LRDETAAVRAPRQVPFDVRLAFVGELMSDAVAKTIDDLAARHENEIPAAPGRFRLATIRRRW